MLLLEIFSPKNTYKDFKLSEQKTKQKPAESPKNTYKDFKLICNSQDLLFFSESKEYL